MMSSHGNLHHSPKHLSSNWATPASLVSSRRTSRSFLAFVPWQGVWKIYCGSNLETLSFSICFGITLGAVELGAPKMCDPQIHMVSPGSVVIFSMCAALLIRLDLYLPHGKSNSQGHRFCFDFPFADRIEFSTKHWSKFGYGIHLLAEIIELSCGKHDSLWIRC